MIALGATADASAGASAQSFRSESWLHPPSVSTSGSDPDADDIFLDAQNWVQAGPMILDPQGRLIWFDPLPNRGVARNLEVQSYMGQPVLTYWQGYGNAFGVGEDVILNQSYQTVATVQAGNGYVAGAHDFVITPQGTALITAYRVTPADLSSIGGPRHGQLVDSAIQEINIATGQLVWQWSARQHVRLTWSHAGRPGKGAYDFFHMNSIQPLANGNLLVSARNMWAVYEIDKQTGKVLWTLGGKHSSFMLGPGANFEWQHDATMQPGGTITLFDNATNGIASAEPQSRALRIHLNRKRRRARLVRAYTNQPPLLSPSEGNVQVLANGNTFVGWGAQPYFAEFGRHGRQLFSGHLSAPLQSYRVFRFRWSGQPTSPPDIAVAPTEQGTTVYAAWNGATDVAAWRVLAGPSETSLSPTGQFPKTGFETQMWVGSTQAYFAVQALDQHRQVLNTSLVIPR
jgi:hypothetical protein